jgi:hypothetical protein
LCFVVNIRKIAKMLVPATIMLNARHLSHWLNFCLFCIYVLYGVLFET